MKTIEIYEIELDKGTIEKIVENHKTASHASSVTISGKYYAKTNESATDMSAIRLGIGVILGVSVSIVLLCISV